MSSDEQKSDTMQLMKKINDSIIEKVAESYVEALMEHKLFNNIVETKQDIHRVFREKRFVNSTVRGLGETYQQPKMNKRNYKSMEKSEQSQLNQQATSFIKNIRIQKKEYEGKFYLLKRKQLERHRDLEQKKKVEEIMQKEMEKKMRKIRAEKNIQFFNKKRLIALKNSKVFPGNRKIQAEGNEGETHMERLKTSEIFQLDLQEIQQQETQGFPKGVGPSTVRKHHKRSHTQANDRTVENNSRSSKYRYQNDDSYDDSEVSYEKKEKTISRHNSSFHQNEENIGFRLVNMEQSTKRERNVEGSSSRFTKRQTSKKFDPGEKKFYHMKRANTEDISMIEQSPVNYSQFNRNLGKQDSGQEDEDSSHLKKSVYTSLHSKKEYNENQKSYSISPIKLPLLNQKAGRIAHQKRFRTMSHAD